MSNDVPTSGIKSSWVGKSSSRRPQRMLPEIEEYDPSELTESKKRERLVALRREKMLCDQEANKLESDARRFDLLKQRAREMRRMIVATENR